MACLGVTSCVSFKYRIGVFCISQSASAVSVAVTGASGYIAGHVIEQLLSNGYRVKGSVRSLADDAKVTALFHVCQGWCHGKCSISSCPVMLSSFSQSKSLSGATLAGEVSWTGVV